jgi:hypothetical protein
MTIETFNPTTGAAPAERADSALLANPAAGRTRQAGPGAPPALVTVSLVLLIAELWLTTRYYRGIVGDARFYMVQALREIDPSRFADDLYFRFGSQDRYTIFTRLYAPLVAHWGIGATAMVCTIAGQLLWLGGLIYCAGGLIRHRSYALLAVAAAIILPNTSPLFGYGDEFVTPRLFAEGLSLLAFGLLVRGHSWRALAVLAVAAALHPLTALPGLGFALLYLAIGRRLWWIAIAVGTAAAVGLSLTDVQPFAALRSTFDPAWFDVVRVRDLQCLVSAWPADAYFRVFETTALAVLALAVAPQWERRFLGVALGVGLGGIAVALIGGDLARNVLIVQIQPWRSMWLLTVLAQFYAVPTLIRLRAQGRGFDVVVLMFVTALGSDIASRFSATIVFAAAPLMLATMALALWQMRTGRLPSQSIRSLGLFAVATVCAIAIVLCGVPAVLLRIWPQEFDRLVCSAVLLALSATIMALWLRRPALPNARLGYWLAGASALLMVAAGVNWDGRSPWTKFIESPAPPPNSLATLLPQDASVYWEGGLELLWFKLQRPSFFSCGQGTGIVFFRGTAMAFRDSGEGLWPLRVADFGSSILCPNLNTAAKPERTRADLQYACEHQPHLDYLVLTRPVVGVGATIWRAPASFGDVRISQGTTAVIDTSEFYVYSCAALSRLPAAVPRAHLSGTAARRDTDGIASWLLRLA